MFGTYTATQSIVLGKYNAFANVFQLILTKIEINYKISMFGIYTASQSMDLCNFLSLNINNSKDLPFIMFFTRAKPTHTHALYIL